MWIITNKETKRVTRIAETKQAYNEEFQMQYEYNGEIPECKPAEKYHTAHQTYDGVNFDTEYVLNEGAVNGGILDEEQKLRSEDYKTIKNIEVFLPLYLTRPELSREEIMDMLPYNPVELHNIHQPWRDEIDRLEGLE